jgi:hypothetical protein
MDFFNDITKQKWSKGDQITHYFIFNNISNIWKQYFEICGVFFIMDEPVNVTFYRAHKNGKNQKKILQL